PKNWRSRYSKLVGQLKKAFPSLNKVGYTAHPVVEGFYEWDEDPEIGEAIAADVLPVCLLLSMPEDWQDKMLKVMEAYAEESDEEGENEWEEDEEVSYEVRSEGFDKFYNRKEIFEPFTETKLWGVGGTETDKAITELEQGMRQSKDKVVEGDRHESAITSL
ncbi:MAG TPA: hypothetical protein V6C57_06585, partial [Coleofasciculaceae cyanobacterium]